MMVRRQHYIETPAGLYVLRVTHIQFPGYRSEMALPNDSPFQGNWK